MSSSTDFIVLDSVNRTSYSTGSHDFDLKLSSPIEGRYQIVTCIIPNTFYNINSYNNKIYFNDGAERTATITPGIYSGSTLPAAIKAAMDDQSTITFTITISSSTNKITITGDSAYILSFGTYTSNSSAAILGFPATNSSSALAQTATNVLNLAYPSGILVRINNADNVSTSQPGVSGTLYFPIETNSSDLSIFRSESTYSMFVDFQRSNLLHIQVLDVQGLPLDLNGANFQMCLKKCHLH